MVFAALVGVIKTIAKGQRQEVGSNKKLLLNRGRHSSVGRQSVKARRRRKKQHQEANRKWRTEKRKSRES